jgi:hypothetical protein
VNNRDVLNAAADYIEQYGWTQDNYAEGVMPGVWMLDRVINYIKTEHPPVCVIGSVFAVAHPQQATAFEHTLISKFYSRYGIDPASWNDQGGRTKEEVVAALRELAEAS